MVSKIITYNRKRFANVKRYLAWKMGKKARKPLKLKYTGKSRLIKAIRREMARKMELKSTTLVGASASNILPGGLNDAGTLGYISRDLCSASINQGTGVSDRIGNRITIKKHILKVSVNSLFNASNSAPFRVHFILYRNRNNNSYDNTSEILQFENTSFDINGSLLREQYPFNKELFTVKRHIVKTMVYVPASGTNDINNSTRFSYTFSVDLTNLLPKVWKYDDDDSGIPENAHLYMAAYIVPTNGSTTLTGAMANLVWSQSIYYTDA